MPSFLELSRHFCNKESNKKCRSIEINLIPNHKVKMNKQQLKKLQQERIDNKIQVPSDLKQYTCKYCEKPIVKITIIAKYFKVIWLNDDSVYWIDEKGNRRKDLILSVDHVFPLSKGGKNRLHNKVYSCKPCNYKKDNKLALLLDDGDIAFLEE